MINHYFDIIEYIKTYFQNSVTFRYHYYRWRSGTNNHSFLHSCENQFYNTSILWSNKCCNDLYKRCVIDLFVLFQISTFFLYYFHVTCKALHNSIFWWSLDEDLPVDDETTTTKILPSEDTDQTPEIEYKGIILGLRMK